MNWYISKIAWKLFKNFCGRKKFRMDKLGKIINGAFEKWENYLTYSDILINYYR